MSSPRSTEGRGPRGVAVLGSTGSIGRQTLDVLGLHPDAFRIVALAAGTNGQLLAEQVARWRPAAVALGAGARIDLPPGTSRISGDDALTALAARDDVDIVIVATGGILSLRPVIAALEAGKVVATANKETLVAGGHLVMQLARGLADAVAKAHPG
ncbi:MAG: 1-deoxy-D-xylulose-5-phosphate reductoisomerase, partial [Chloroflexota bacterium]|nr:1-deoxy-D-xylulose-5-phosphate reductoisomerase [Chloroflexota bacterium]